MLKPLRLLMTGAGAPGFPSIFNCLKNNGERKIYIVGVDMNPAVNTRTAVDMFYQVPAAIEEERFIEAVIEICKKEDVDVIIPIVTKELELFAKSNDRFEAIGTRITVMDYEHLHIANNKGILFSELKKRGISTPDFMIANTPDELEESIFGLGYPDRPVVVKPTFGNGSRGTRILDTSKSRYEQFFNEKPNSQYISIEELMAIIREKKKIPEMMVMEYLPYEEVSVDILADHGRTLYYSCRQGKVINSIMVSSTVVLHKEAIELAKIITKELQLDGVVSFDMKANLNGIIQIMEINPRLPAGIVNSVVAGINFPYLRVKQVLGEELPPYEVKEGYSMQFRNEEVLYNPDGTLVDWKRHI